MKIAPSILSMDFSRLADGIQMLDKTDADWIHLDIMDGVFVPNMTFGPPMVRALRPLTDKFFDVHLMMEKPLALLEDFIAAGADMVSVHAECADARHLNRMIRRIKDGGAKAGVVLNPATPVCAVDYMLEDVDMVLCMSVNPGFGGQAFIPQTLRKLSQLKTRVRELGLDMEVQVDGGVNLSNAGAILAAGATVLVAGSAIVDAADPRAVIAAFKAL
ncbi:MAG: ribulose-phosphate 3-epimerase [Christensenellales bacterium]|jgi:ribulose-phosphate 3-epimerase